MFKKLVTNLPFSPGLASQVSFYAKRLKQEESIRRFGLLFVALSMTAQSFMIISPPEAAIAVGPNNIIYSGVTSKDDLLQKYLNGSDGNGHDDIKQIFDYYKINETSIMNAREVSIASTDRDGNLRSIGRYKQGFASETTVPIPGTTTTVYERNLSDWNGGPYRALEGERTDGTYFAVLMSCGNLVIDSEDEPERPPEFSISLTCEAIVGKAFDPDGDEVPLRAWIRVVNEPKTTGNWIDITGKLPYTIPENLKSSENVTRVSVEAQDIDTGQWLPVLVGAEVGPCLDPPPPPVTKIACTSLRWIDTQNVSLITLEAKAFVENTLVIAFNFRIVDSQNSVVATKTIETDKTTTSYTVDLEDPGTYTATVAVVTDQGNQTSESCEETIIISNPVKPVFEILRNKEASNITQQIEDANNTVAKPGDNIEYRLITRNTGNVAGDVDIKENMSDVLEYSQLLEAQDAKYHEGTGILDWGTVELQPNETDIRIVKVRINDSIPATARSAGDLASYDLVLRNVYGDDVVNIKVPCSSAGKCVEGIVQTLPNTGPGLSTFINTILIMSSVFFYMRNRQTSRELRLIKSEYNYSTQGA